MSKRKIKSKSARRPGTGVPKHVIAQLQGDVEAQIAGLRSTIEAEIAKAHYRQDCEHCGTNLYPAPPEPYRFFMLVNQVSRIASLDGRINCLCLDCTESVLGTPLPSWTFNTDEMVPGFMLTAELQDRLNPATDGEFQWRRMPNGWPSHAVSSRTWR